ncbi:MAG: hypothetical protein DWQ05_12980 [Calditrichaeota bacterium]|nr:MAG: hypothetical protein DWQ05_12980 [Calditrichota bacterium]
MVCAFSLRFSLFLLPAPGRDEATYFYWSQHFEPAYSLLLQLLVKFAALLPISALVSLRLPSLIGGVIVLVLLNKILKQHGFDRSLRQIVLTAVAFTPWQIYVGSILHPDNIFLIALLLAVIAESSNRYLLFSLFIGLAVLAKPTGLVILATGILYILFLKKLPTSQKLGLIAICLFVALPVLLNLNSEMLAAMAEFGRVSESISTTEVIVIALFSLIGLGGLLLPFSAGHVIKSKWKNAIRHLLNPGKNSLLLWFAGALLITFILAALVRNQIKGNWILPAFVLLIPLYRSEPWRKFVWTNLLFSIVLSAGMTLFFIFPGTLKDFEHSFKFVNKTYVAQAGVRENKISTTSSWENRVAEYQSLHHFQNEVQSFWMLHSKNTVHPQWLICDDYGLAAQLIFAWNKCATRLVIPADGIFFSSQMLAKKEMRGHVLVLAVHTSANEIWSQLPAIADKKLVHHPVTGSAIEIAVMDIPITWPENYE